MPVIHQFDGRVIAWSGLTAGPVQEYEPIGTESPWVRYEAEVGGTGERSRVKVRVEKAWRRDVFIVDEEATEKRVVGRFIEERVKDTTQPELEPGAETNFTILRSQMVEMARMWGNASFRVDLDDHGQVIPTGEGQLSATIFNPGRSDVTLRFRPAEMEILKTRLSARGGGIHLPASYLQNAAFYHIVFQRLMELGWNPSVEPVKLVSANELL
jgi:hypothetical protein